MKQRAIWKTLELNPPPLAQLVPSIGLHRTIFTMSQHTLKPSYSFHSCSVFELFCSLARLQTAENLDWNAVINLSGPLIVITGERKAWK